uniref:prephenate dehydrogenase n=1 Tax=uncultured Thiotrichaceae bacterium TaxID=298394 RepID=A0A6S6SF60_9GAMM|nr:MAG: Cyclohexadienyl dehydrogenase (EC (EC [uncultured Thiotrichaceae bacterium]
MLALVIKKLVIFGVGLIGGSLALALRDAGYCERIVGCSRSAEHLQKAVDLGVIDSFTLDPLEAVKDADMIFLAVPIGAMRTVLEQIMPALEPGAVLTDGGSAKTAIVEAAKDVLSDDVLARFVPGHPIAGRERSGVEAALGDLYKGKRVILTPLDSTSSDAVTRVDAMWQATGAVLESMPMALHDEVLAATSHLPHVLAFSLVDTLLSMPQREDILRYAAGGFKDFTRIASSDPVMWRDICLHNGAAILDVIEAMQANLGEFAELIRQQNGDDLLQRMESSKQARDRYVAQLDAG